MVQTVHLQQQQTRHSRRRSTEGYEPRYQVTEEQDGFWVEGRERKSVYVSLSPSRTLLLVGESREAVRGSDERAGRHQAVWCFPCGLYQYYHLLEAIASMTMQDWQPPADAGNWGENAVRIWALERTSRALHRRGVYEQWQRLLGLVPEHKRLVSKAVFAATFDREGLGAEIWPEVYEHPYLVSDVLRYRAAAVAVHYAGEMAVQVGSLITHLRELGYDRLQTGPLSPRFEALAQANVASRVMGVQQDDGRSEIVDLLADNWMALFSCSGSAGTSVRRTVMNLPGGISGRLLSEFAAVDLLLSRPVTDRVELTTLLLFGRSLAVEDLISPACWERAMYVRARREALLTALRHLSAHLRRPLKPWQQGLSTLVGMTLDYCRSCRQEGVVGHEGSIVGLVDKAIAWHRQVREETVKRALAAFGDTTATALPPVPLPNDHAIRFLDSVGDLYHEGVAMSHCIATYARLAISGQCYLFHVEHGGQSASVQVDPAGRVVQSYGQHNSRKSASEYGTRALGRWGKALAALQPAQPPQPDDDDAVLLGDPFPF